MASESSKKAFSKFLEFCRSATEDDSEVLKLLQKRFNKTSRTYLNSEAFFSLLHRTREQIKDDSSRKFVYIKEFISELRAYGEVVHTKLERCNQEAGSEPPSKKARMSEPVNHTTRDLSVKLSSSESLHPKSTLCSGKPKLTEKQMTPVNLIEKPSGSKTPSDERETPNLIKSQVFLQTLGLSPKVILSDCRSSVKTGDSISEPSLLSEHSSAEKRQHKIAQHSSCLLDLNSGDSDLEKNSQKASEKQIEKLEVLLGKLSNEIERLEEVELDLDDLGQEDSNYILLDKYKAKFVKVWDKLCELKGRTSSTGRPVERRFRFEGTRYSVINKKVEKFINKHNIFPDYPDIHTIICYCNKKHNLKLRKKVLHELAKDVFTEVGNRLQKRRLEDFMSNFGSHLTDRYKAHDDPAFYDKHLRRKLEENQAESKSKLDEVINKYAAKQFAEDEPTTEEEDDEDKDDDSQGTCMNDEHAIDTDPDDDDDDDDVAQDKEEDFFEEDREIEDNSNTSCSQGNEASKESASHSSSLKRKHMFRSIFMRQNSGESSGVDTDDHSGDTPANRVQINRQQASDTMKDLIKEPVKVPTDDSTNRRRRRVETIRLLSPDTQHNDAALEIHPEETQMSSSSNSSSETAAENSLQCDVSSKEHSESRGSFVINNVYSLSNDGGLCNGKDGSILSGTSPTSHSSDKENIGSPLIHCDKTLQSDHNLASLSPDIDDPELPTLRTNNDDCIDMGIVVSSTANLTSQNNRPKLSHNVQLNRSDDGIKQASRALKAVLNKFGDAITTKTTSPPTIELLSESSDGESNEGGKAEMCLKEVSAADDGRLVAASIRSNRNREGEIKTTDVSSSLSFTADVHAEHSRPHSNNSSSSICGGEKTVDHEVSVADEDVLCSPTPKSCTENVDGFTDDKDQHGTLPSEESCEQTQNKELSGSKTVENDEHPEVSADESKSPCQTNIEDHQDDDPIGQMPCQEDAEPSDSKYNSSTNNPTTSVPSGHQLEQAGCSVETSPASNDNGMIQGCSPNNSELTDMKDDKQTVDASGQSSRDAVISVDAAGDASLDSDDDCVMIMQVDMKHKRAAVKSERPDATAVPTNNTTSTVGSSLLNGFDLNSICSSVVSKVLQEKRPHPANVTSVPPQIATKSRQLVTTTAYAGNRLQPFLHRASNIQPSFQPVATSTPVKHQQLLRVTTKGPVTNSARYGLGTNMLNQANSTASSHRSHVPNVGNLYGRTGTITLTTRGNQATKDLLIIKPMTQKQSTMAIVGTAMNSNNTDNHLVRTARRRRRRNQVDNSDVIVLSDSD